MNRHPLRRLAATLLLSLLMLSSPADASLWKVGRVVCPDGTLVTSPTTCPPQPRVWGT